MPNLLESARVTAMFFRHRFMLRASLFSLAVLSVLGIPAIAQAEDIRHLSRLLQTQECAKCNLRGSGLVFANLARSDMSGADLRDANLGRADLTESKLVNADLRGATLTGAKLGGADLRGAKLNGASLLEADLSGADLRGADLSGVDLRQAYLTAAKLEGAKFDGAYLRGAIDLPATVLRPEDIYVWGLEESRRGNHREAIGLYSQSLAMKQDFAHAYLARAMSLQQMGDKEGAIRDAEVAQQLYEKQENPEGAKFSKEMAAALKRPPEGDGGGWGGVLNTVGSILLQFLMR